MPKARLILHLGGVKCGSSALQTALSQVDLKDKRSGSHSVVYAAILPKGRVMTGERLRRRARQNSFGYVASASPAHLAVLDTATLKAAADEIQTLLNAGNTVILSNEGWLQTREKAVTTGFLDALGVPFHAFASIRPQVGYMNSGWWQWGAWSGYDLPTWVSRKMASSLWNTHLETWRRHPLCEALHVAPLGGDILSDFCQQVGLKIVDGTQATSPVTSNVSLPAELLRLFQRHKHLRPAVNTSAIDFSLARLGIGSGKTPWVIEPALCRSIIEACRADNEALCAAVDADTSLNIRNDPKWWSVEAYADKRAEPAAPLPPDAEELDRVCAEMAEALFAMERKLRRFEG